MSGWALSCSGGSQQPTHLNGSFSWWDVEFTLLLFQGIGERTLPWAGFNNQAVRAKPTLCFRTAMMDVSIMRAHRMPMNDPKSSRRRHDWCWYHSQRLHSLRSPCGRVCNSVIMKCFVMIHDSPLTWYGIFRKLLSLLIFVCRFHPEASFRSHSLSNFLQRFSVFIIVPYYLTNMRATV